MCSRYSKVLTALCSQISPYSAIIGIHSNAYALSVRATAPHRQTTKLLTTLTATNVETIDTTEEQQNSIQQGCINPTTMLIQPPTPCVNLFTDVYSGFHSPASDYDWTDDSTLVGSCSSCPPSPSSSHKASPSDSIPASHLLVLPSVARRARTMRSHHIQESSFQMEDMVTGTASGQSVKGVYKHNRATLKTTSYKRKTAGPSALTACKRAMKQQGKKQKRARKIKKRPKCEWCGRAFNRPADVQRHVETIHVERTFECPDCHAVLSRADALQRHMRTCKAWPVGDGAGTLLAPR